MRFFQVVLILGCIVAFLASVAAFLLSKSVTHEILSVVLLLLSAICFSGAGTIEGLAVIEKRLQDIQTNQVADIQQDETATRYARETRNILKDKVDGVAG